MQIIMYTCTRICAHVYVHARNRSRKCESAPNTNVTRTHVCKSVCVCVSGRKKCACVHVCMSACMRTCMHAPHARTSMQVNECTSYLRKCGCTYTSMHVCLYACTYACNAYVRTHACTCVRTSSSMQSHTRM
jgi:hypothetical protein